MNVAIAFGYGTYWILLFAKGYKIQIGCTNDGFGIWKANKHCFISARLQLAC
jgi:hypothetical protein